jgi:hypothetical protein
MVLSKREQIILIMTVIAVGVFAGDKFVVTPITDKLEALDTQREQLKQELADADILFHKQRRLQETWEKLVAEGFRNGAEAEGRILGVLNDWSGEVGLKVSSIRPERMPSDKDLQEMIFAFGGSGSLQAVAQLLWQIETSPLPIKIKSMTLGSSGDTGEQMSLTLGVSAVYLGEAPKKSQTNLPEVTNGNEDQLL